MAIPILYSYRRCPYAMRARMALSYAGIEVEIREISLQHKPAHLLQVSPKGTVPVLVLPQGVVIEQSLDIMRWALTLADKDGWLEVDTTKTAWLIAENDGDFKQNLDRYKYATRFPEHSAEFYRTQGALFLAQLEALLGQHQFLLADSPSLADIAIFPFVRQFAAVDVQWFEASHYQHVQRWLQYLVSTALFSKVMAKYPTYVSMDIY